MIPGRFAYVAPDDVEGCVAALVDAGDGARVLGGGTWVVPEMSRGESRPRCVVDLRAAGLAQLHDTPRGIWVGAMCTYAQLLASDAVARTAPLLATMAAGITGGWALRHQATVGGSAVSARPQSDVPGAMAALGAVATVAGPGGRRQLAAEELVVGPMRTGLHADEVLVGFDVPGVAGRGSGYVKVKVGGSSWPIATAGALVGRDGDGRCTSARLALGAVAGRPVVLDVAALVGTRCEPDALREVARRAAGEVEDWWDDVLAPASYRAAVAATVARRALEAALADGPAPAGRVS